MNRDEFMSWHKRLGFTKKTGAQALGISESAYTNYMIGVRRDVGKPVVYDRKTMLACAAVEAGLKPLGANDCATMLDCEGGIP